MDINIVAIKLLSVEKKGEMSSINMFFQKLSILHVSCLEISDE